MPGLTHTHMRPRVHMPPHARTYSHKPTQDQEPYIPIEQHSWGRMHMHNNAQPRKQAATCVYSFTVMCCHTMLPTHAHCLTHILTRARKPPRKPCHPNRTLQPKKRGSPPKHIVVREILFWVNNSFLHRDMFHHCLLFCQSLNMAKHRNKKYDCLSNLYYSIQCVLRNIFLTYIMCP